MSLRLARPELVEERARSDRLVEPRARCSSSDRLSTSVLCFSTDIMRGWLASSRSRRPSLQTAPATEARLAEGARAGLAELPAAQEPDAGAQPAHGLRRSAVPEHRRVLEPRHGDVHDPRRRLHARVLVLRGGARPSARGRHRRTGPRRRRHPHARSQLRRHHVGRSRRSRGRRRVDLRRHGPRDARAAAALPHRSADSRFPGQRGGAARGARRAARHPEPQHRNRPAAVPDGALRRALRADARTARSLAALRAGDPDQDRRHGRPGRRARRARRHVQGSARRRLRHPHRRPVPAAVTPRTRRWSATTIPTSFRR